jgi:hypothetical protein
MKMTSRQRVQAALSHIEPDRTPVFEYVLLSPLADIFIGRIYAGDPVHWDRLESERGWESAVRQNAIDRIELAQNLGHDLIYATPIPLPWQAQRDLDADYPKPGLDPVETMQRRNTWQADHLDPPDDSLLIYACLKEEMAKRGMDLPLLAPAYAHGVWTDTDLMQTMVLDQETAQRHFELCTLKCLKLIEKYRQLGIEIVGIGGDFSGTRPIISPRFYRTYIVPQLAILSDAIHTGGMLAVNASDGDLWSVIDDFLINSRVDGYLEIDLHAGMDLPRLKAAYGDRITFLGNLDCGIELSFGTPEIVRQHTIDCLQAGWGNGGHILCASNAITASVPLENYLAAVNAYREYFSLDLVNIA